MKIMARKVTRRLFWLKKVDPITILKLETIVEVGICNSRKYVLTLLEAFLLGN